MAAENIQNRVHDKFPNLETMVARSLWPTPAARDYKDSAGAKSQAERGRTAGDSLGVSVGGALNPTWVEWLMGFPEGWTDLSASETQSSRKSQK